MEYPKTKYPMVGGGSITVTSPEHEKTIGPGWVDHEPSRESTHVPKRKAKQIEAT